MGFITKLGLVILIAAVIFIIFFGEVTFAPFTGGLDYPVSYALFLLGVVLLVIGIWFGRRRPAYR